jgi:hypothetical protein
MDCVGESRLRLPFGARRGRLTARLTITLMLLEGRASHLDSHSIRATSSHSSARAWFSGMENRCNEQSNDQRTLKGSPFDDPLSSNSKCNTSRPDGLRCCHGNEILQTHKCRRP